MNKPEVVADDPLEGVQVERPLEAGDGRHKLGLAEEAHADVVPELRRARGVHGGNAVPRPTPASPFDKQKCCFCGRFFSNVFANYLLERQ